MHIVQFLPPLLKEAHAPHFQSEAEGEEAMMGGLWVLVVMVVGGVVHAGCVCAASPCCSVWLTHLSVLKHCKPRHIGDRRKALDETNQTIKFNQGKSVGSDERLMNLDYSWQCLA